MSAIRTERLLNLLTFLLNARRPVSLREIREMDEFRAYRTDDSKSGERAFERDKATLVELGVPLRWVAPEQIDDDEEGVGGYLIDRERYFLADPKLTPSELALLSIAGASVAAMDGFPLRGAVIRALAKLGFDVDERGSAPALAHAPLEPGLDAERVGGHLQVIHEALRRRHRLSMTYRGINDSRSERCIDPFGLYYRNSAWYLVGFCHLRQAERTFHVGRVIALAEVPGKSGPAFDVPPEFQLKDHVQRRPWEFPLQTEQEVVIRLAARLVPAIPEIFGPRARVESLPEGVMVRLSVAHPQALIETVLPYGAAAQVISPLDLRREIRCIYETLAARYGASTAGLAMAAEGGERR